MAQIAINTQTGKSSEWYENFYELQYHIKGLGERPA
jgi:hypothetical protein